MATRSKGIKFAYGTDVAEFDDLTTGWTLVGFVLDSTFPEPETDDIETTNHDTVGLARTYLSGLIEGGESETSHHYVQATYSAIKAIHAAGTAKRFRLILSDGSGVGWDGYFKKPSIEADLEGLNMMKIATKVSGDLVTIAALS